MIGSRPHSAYPLEMVRLACRRGERRGQYRKKTLLRECCREIVLVRQVSASWRNGRRLWRVGGKLLANDLMGRAA